MFMNPLSVGLAWCHRVNARIALRLFRKDRYLLAALFRQFGKLSVGIALLLVVSIHYASDPSLLVRYGKPFIAGIGIATIAVNTYYSYASYRYRAKNHRFRSQHRAAKRRLEQQLP